MGTAAGTSIFLKFGWPAAAAFSMGLYAFQIIILLFRGPQCTRYTWFGYQGRLESNHKTVDEQKRETALAEEEKRRGADANGEKPVQPETRRC